MPALLVDGRLEQYTLGPPQEITDRLFVVRRAFRVNDSLPQDSALPGPGFWWTALPHIWQITLPESDPHYSVASWCRDYVAYCGVSEEGKKPHASSLN